MDIWYELTHTASQERGYKEMIGDVAEMNALRTVAGSSEALPARTLYVPLQFWFCRNTGLALPLIALQYHEVRVNVEFESLNRLLVWSGSAPALSNFSFTSASLMVDYVYLDSEERRRFAQVGHEYLIEQVQYTEESVTPASGSANVNQKVKLNFNHPCKELVWACKVGAFTGGDLSNSFSGVNKFLAYTHDDNKWHDELTRVAKGLCESMVTGSNNNGNGLDAAAALTAPQVSGPLRVTTVGAIADDKLEITTDRYQTAAAAYLTDAIVSADLVVTLDGASAIVSVECVSVSHVLTLRDLSVPLGSLTATPAADAVDRANHKEISVVQNFNYGLRLDGKGNPMKEGNLQLNGHDRFSTQEGNYFNQWQTRSHTRTPSDGVNVYAFALNPENHQPSGTANLSRIDSTLLVLTLSDALRPKSSGAVTLDWTADTKLWVFAVNYNVLRVMSGMGGLAYSN